MIVSEMNSTLREMFFEFLNKGYKKNHMCEVTLGLGSNPQFDQFLKGHDLGSIPLTRMFEGLGFELHLIPVKKTDREKLETVSALSDNFLNESKDKLEKFLSSKTSGRIPSETKEAFATQVEKILKELGLDKEKTS